MHFFKVRIPIAIAFTMAVVAMTSMFVSHHYSNTFIKETAYWSKAISGVTMFIGAFSLLRVHFNKVKRKVKGWGYSIVLYLFFAMMLTFGLLNFGSKVVGQSRGFTENDANALATRLQERGVSPTVRPVQLENGEALTDEHGQAMFVVVDPAESNKAHYRALVSATGKTMVGAQGLPLYIDLRDGKVTETLPVGCLGPLKPRTTLKDRDPTNWLYQSVQRPASATQYSLLGFFICSAAYRTFRAKTPLAAVLLVSALIVMLGQVPIAALIWDKIPILSGWLLDIPNMAVKRAILFGICVGSVGTSLRVMFGVERSYMGGE